MDQDDKAPEEPKSWPAERAFSGHPDHPPAQPDQSVENNRPLLGDGVDAAEGEPPPL